MRQQVGHAEHRVGLIIADVHLYHLAVGGRHHAVQRQGQRRPLVVLDAAVVVGVQKREVVGLVQRVLLDVEARRVDMRPQDVHALGDRRGPHVHEDDCLPLGAGPQLAARPHGRAGGDAIGQRVVAGVLGRGDGGRGALALGFVVGDEVDVVSSQRLNLGRCCLVVLLPSYFAFHETSFLLCDRAQYEPIYGEKFGNCYILFSRCAKRALRTIMAQTLRRCRRYPRKEDSMNLRDVIPTAENSSNFNVVPESITEVGTTLENLKAAVCGETGASAKYAACAAAAKEQGFDQIARLFEATSAAEQIHIGLEAGVIAEIEPGYERPAAPEAEGIATDLNLIAGALGEIYETSDMYPSFIKVAQEEGNKKAEFVFTRAKLAEAVHAELYMDAYNNIDAPTDEAYYLCPICGYIHKGDDFEKCPICFTPADKFRKF